MPPEAYLLMKTLHVCSIMVLFTAMGSVILSTTPRYFKAASILHGVSLLFILITGFGMIGNPGIGPKFWIPKLIILILIGGSLTLAKRKILHTPVILTIILILGFAAAALGIYKPF